MVGYLLLLGTFITMTVLSEGANNAFHWWGVCSIVWGLGGGYAAGYAAGQVLYYYNHFHHNLQLLLWRREKDCELPYTSSFWLDDKNPDETIRREQDWFGW